MDVAFNKLAEENDFFINVKITEYADSKPIASKTTVLESNEGDICINDAQWRYTCNTECSSGAYSVVDVNLEFAILKGSLKNANAGFSLVFKNWSGDRYVIMPGAIYAGNRFEWRNMKYPPQFCHPGDLRTDIPTIITDVPRLNVTGEYSKIQLLAGDLSTPAVGFFNSRQKKGFWLLTDQHTSWGDLGIAMEENGDKSQAEITVSAPGVRQENRYTLCNTRNVSEDRGAYFVEGDRINIRGRLHFFECHDMRDFFSYFADIRKTLTGEVKQHHQIPASAAWEIQEAKYNSQNWENEHGYYSVGLRENIYQDWQIGWVGGLMGTYALLAEGSEKSKARVLRNLDFVFNGGQDSSGFFYGCGHKGKWYGDNFHHPYKKWHLIRKSSDALYFLIKQFMLLEKQYPEFVIPEKWLSGARRCAGAFVGLWDKYGQFGQFVDTETGDIIVGGSASAGIAPAALVLAGMYFKDHRYIDTAKAACEYFYEKFTKKGYTTGGPGEILQCPDSESAFGLLESFIVLYEALAEEKWLTMAKEQADQCFTWCVSYDFKFPPESTFGKLGMHTAGSVFANVQNKHSAPGICTLSGDSLFKLFRATGNKKYLELLQEIAHNLSQYLSRQDRPILAWNRNLGAGDGSWREMPAGWMSERVNMSDWMEPVGEVFYGSCWCEVTNMLTFAEVPGLYIQPDTGFICAFDHIDAEVAGYTEDQIEVRISNPTEFKAEVKIFVENSDQMNEALGCNRLCRGERIKLQPFSVVHMKFAKK